MCKLSALLQPLIVARLGAVMLRMVAHALAKTAFRSAFFVLQRAPKSWTPLVQLLGADATWPRMMLELQGFVSPLGTPLGAESFGTLAPSGWAAGALKAWFAAQGYKAEVRQIPWVYTVDVLHVAW
jgi:hypothetical protein